MRGPLNLSVATTSDGGILIRGLPDGPIDPAEARRLVELLAPLVGGMFVETPELGRG